MKMKALLFLRSIARKWTIDPIELALWVAPIILFSPGIFGGKVFYWGTILLQFIPWRHLALELIKGGEIPLWNPYSGMGAPLLANYQSALLYPPTWMLMALEAIGGLSWSAIGQGVSLALHLGFCAVGTRRMLREWGLSDLGQIVGGIAFGLSGYLVSRASFQSIIFSVSWMPWIVLFSQRVALSSGKPKRLGFFWLVICIAMNLLAGHAQSSWYILWTTTAFFVWQSLLLKPIGWWETWKRLAKNFLLWGGAVGWAVLLAAAQLIPTVEYLMNSQRSTGIDRELGLTYSFWPWRFLTMLMPDFFGSPEHGNYWGYGNYWEDAVYSGSMAILLAIFAFGKIWHRSENRSAKIDAQKYLKVNVLAWAGMGILAMVLALGKNLPFYTWMFETVPGFDLFQAPTRISLIAQFSLAILAAIGIDLWGTPRGKVLYWTRLGTAGFFSMLLVSSLASFFLQEDFYPTILKSVQQFGLLGLIFGVLLLCKPEEQSKLTDLGNRKPLVRSIRIWKILIIAFFLVDLGWVGWGLNPVISIELFRQPFQNEKAGSPAFSRRFFIHPDDEYTIKFEKFFRFDTFRNIEDWVPLRRSWLPNINLLDEVAMVNNFDPFVPDRFAKWLESITKARREGQELVYQRLLKISGVQVLIEIDGEGELKTIPLEGSERFQFFECAKKVRTSEEALEAVLRNPELGLNQIVVETTEANGDEHCLMKPDLSPSIRILSESANRIQIELDTHRQGWLVMKDTYYPGWVAWVNGAKAPIFAANSIFRAVRVDEGINLIEFRYQPLSFSLGVTMSVLSLLLLILYPGMQKDD
jgi:hypothetical protein